MDGYKNITRLLRPANSPESANGEFTILDDPTVTVIESIKPAAEPEAITAINRRLKSRHKRLAYPTNN